MKYTEHYRVNSHDTDPGGTVRPSAMLRYIQETANLQHFNIGPTTAELREANKAFILSRTAMSIYSPLYDFDEITVQTWFSEIKGYSITRYGRITRGDELIAESGSVWAMIYIDSKKLYRPQYEDYKFTPDEKLDFEIPQRIRIPKDAEMTLMGERTVRYSDIDINRHMNNTVYPDMLCDFVPDMDGLRVSSFAISYNAEAPLGVSFKVYMLREGNEAYFRTVLPEGNIGIEAHMSFEETE